MRSGPQGDIKHSPRLAKTQWATREETFNHTPSRSYGRFAVGNGQRRRTDRNRKGKQEGGEKLNFKQLLGLLPEIFMSKCTKNICRPGSARTPLGKLSAPTDPLAIVAGHKDRGKGIRTRRETDGEILFKTIVARGFIFSSKCTRKRLANGLCLDPLGSLSAPLAPNGSGCGRLAARWRRFTVEIDCFPSWFELVIARG